MRTPRTARGAALLAVAIGAILTAQAPARAQTNAFFGSTLVVPSAIRHGYMPAGPPSYGAPTSYVGYYYGHGYVGPRFDYGGSRPVRYSSGAPRFATPAPSYLSPRLQAPGIPGTTPPGYPAGGLFR